MKTLKQSTALYIHRTLHKIYNNGNKPTSLDTSRTTFERGVCKLVDNGKLIKTVTNGVEEYIMTKEMLREYKEYWNIKEEATHNIKEKATESTEAIRECKISPEVKGEKKYKLLEDETIEYNGRTLHRIQALKDFGNVKKGQKGGYIQSERNLSHEGNCWIHDDAMAMDDSKVLDNAMIFDNALMFDHATMYDNSSMFDKTSMYYCTTMYDDASMHNHASMHDHASMRDNASMRDFSSMHWNSSMRDNASMRDYATMRGHSSMHDDTSMRDCATMRDNTSMHNYASMHDHATMHDESEMRDYSKMYGYSRIARNSILFNDVCLRSAIEDTILESNNEFIEFDSIGEYKRTIIYLKKEKLININNCFIGNVDELEEKVLRKYGDKETNYHDVIKTIRALEEGENNEQKIHDIRR